MFITVLGFFIIEVYKGDDVELVERLMIVLVISSLGLLSVMVKEND